MIFTVKKYHNFGNSIAIVQALDCMDDVFIRWLTDKNYGVGVDQLIAIHNIDQYNQKVSLSFFNQDGSCATLCVNGLLCLGEDLKRLHPHVDMWSIDTGYVTTQIDYKKGINVHIPQVQQDTIAPQNMMILDGCSFWEYGDYEYHWFACDIGNPHVVVISKHDPHTIDSVVFKDMHTCFMQQFSFPEGVNFSLMFIPDTESPVIHIRTFERGVWVETLSCGSASVACAAVYSLQHISHEAVRVHPLVGCYNIYCMRDSIHIQITNSPCYVFATSIAWSDFLYWKDIFLQSDTT